MAASTPSVGGSILALWDGVAEDIGAIGDHKAVLPTKLHHGVLLS
jgi:hypothetical protein